MKRFSILCCLVLLLNVLCPVGHVHAEGITTPTDLCDHQYGYWADEENGTCVYGCTICGLVESTGEHEEGWSKSCFISIGAEGHRHTCQNCGTTVSIEPHQTWCERATRCDFCGYEGEIEEVWHSAEYEDTVTIHPDGCKDGSETVTCTNCNTVLRTTVLPGNGEHDWNSETGKCDYCGIDQPCEHSYGNWADGDDCVFGCLKCKMVEQRNSHTLETYFDEDGHWNMCLYCDYETDAVKHTFELQSNEVTHRWQCTECEYFKDDDVHVVFCDNPGVCAVCGCECDREAKHDIVATPNADGKTHKVYCSRCGVSEDQESHQVYYENGTHDEKGHYYPCIVCGATVFYYHWNPEGGKCGSGLTCQYDGCDFVYPDEHPADAIVVKYNEEYHEFFCEACGNYLYSAGHSAICTNPGVCAECGYEDENLTGNHEYGSWADGDDCVHGCVICKEESHRSSHEGSCKDPTHCKYCGAEGDWYADHNWDYYNGSVNDGAEGHHYVCQDCGASSETEKHYAYCDDPTHCIECGYEGTIVRVYHYTGGEVLFDEYTHWEFCTKCGKEINHESHFNDCTDPDHCMYCDYEGTIDGKYLWHGDCAYVCEGDTGHRYECTECGYVEFTSAHVADCTNPNYCIRCDYEGSCTDFYHDYTCTSNGADDHTLTCVNCGTAKTEAHFTRCDNPNHCLYCDYEGEIANVGHYWAGNEGFDADNHWYICPDCGITITEPHYNGECGVESLCGMCYTLYVQEHEWGDPVTANGVRTYTCTLCGATKTENLHTHNWGDPVTVEPTCTTEGTATYTCTCGQTKVETIEALGHSYGACVPTGSGSHTQTCTVCGNTIASSCTMVDTTIGNLDASACIYCGYITWKLDNAANGKQESKAVENAAFQMVDENGAAVDTSTLTLVVYESAPEATIQLDTGASLAIKKALTVTVLEGGAPVKLANTVKLSIPMADDLTGLKLLVVDENGELVEIAYEVVDGVMTFETDILGIFMLVQEI